ncbi:MAG TPA: acyl-CoA dehydrogenase family protein [Candidatus Dormibacteraeota bacterium]|nr:acyl-CoA dehydrogenase family protein [Candidatus Dormibacteraeota bacterium]
MAFPGPFPACGGPVCFQRTTDVMRVFGGYGSSKEYPVEQLYRAAPLLMIGEGTRFLNPTGPTSPTEATYSPTAPHPPNTHPSHRPATGRR